MMSKLESLGSQEDNACCSDNADLPILVIGMFGGGTVGEGVVELIRSLPQDKVVIKTIVARDIYKNRDFNLPHNCKITNQYNHVLNDPEVNCVVEVMGGTTDAWDVIQAAIKQDKHIITANKALLSKYMAEIEALLQEHPNVHFKYEAAVCGGIPIINTIRNSFPYDDITSVKGILNGTTNFILTKMNKGGVGYTEALKLAQDKGYAEANPANDVNGYDARSKICILAKLAFGLTIDEQQIYCQGISGITQVDFEYAKMINHTIKLMGMVVKSDHNSYCDVSICVMPVMVSCDDPILANINFTSNIVSIKSLHTGQTILIGPGAGRGPTANSVASDINELKHHIQNNPKGKAPYAFSLKSYDCRFVSDFESCFYIRLVVDDKVGIIQMMSGCLASHEISIYSILQTPIDNPRKVPFAIITEVCKHSQVNAFLQEVGANRGNGERFSFLVEEPHVMKYSDMSDR